MKHLTFLFLLFLCLIGCKPSEQNSFDNIQHISVLTNDAELLKEVSDTRALRRYTDCLTNMTLTTAPENPNWQYKIYLQTDNGTQRWLYSEDGYIAKLNYALSPCFKTDNLSCMNDLLEE